MAQIPPVIRADGPSADREFVGPGEGMPLVNWSRPELTSAFRQQSSSGQIQASPAKNAKLARALIRNGFANDPGRVYTYSSIGALDDSRMSEGLHLKVEGRFFG
jgi:hypothetical protein